MKGIVKNRRNLATGEVADLIQLTTGRANELWNVIWLSIFDQLQKLSARSPLMLVRPVMLPPGVEPHSEELRRPTWWRVIAYLAATFAPATNSDKGTREKLGDKRS